MMVENSVVRSVAYWVVLKAAPKAVEWAAWMVATTAGLWAALSEPKKAVSSVDHSAVVKAAQTADTSERLWVAASAVRMEPT